VRADDESGQIMVVTALALVLMLVCVGLVVDVGHAMLVQRQLQAGVDAAALAGVQHLPQASVAETVARQYSATPGSKNQVNTVNNAVTTATVSCLAGVPGCTRRDGGVNGITVVSSSRVPTWFGRIIGIRHMEVSAKAVACAPCAVKPLDIMIVLDRTGSMCQFRRPDGSVQNDPSCTDLRNAKDGVRTFLSYLDPSLDKVGLAFLPPVRSPDFYNHCPYTPWQGNGNPNATPPASNTDGRYFGYSAFWPDRRPAPDGYEQLPGWAAEGRIWERTGGSGMSDPSRYVVASLEGADGVAADDYLILDSSDGSWDLNGASRVVQQIGLAMGSQGCQRGAGSTHYALAIEEAQYHLERHGRGGTLAPPSGVQNVIIFLSDGAANTMPTNLPDNHWLDNPTAIARPCGMGVEAANWSKGRGTIVYTIGYDLDGATPGVYERCLAANPSNGQQQASTPANYEQCGSWGCTAYDAMLAMASSPAHFYNRPDPTRLNDIFTQIALDLAGSRGRLIDSTSPLLP
jgi:hypothetical protein